MVAAVRVVVGSNAQTIARQLVEEVGRLEEAANSVVADSATLADKRVWTGATADNFKQVRHEMVYRLERMVGTLRRMADAARTVITDIDIRDELGASAIQHGPGFLDAVALAAQDRDLEHARPLVTGWDDAHDGEPVVTDNGAFQPDDYFYHYGSEEDSNPKNATWVLGKALSGEVYEGYLEAGSLAYAGPAAETFFEHYRDGTGSDLNYSARQPYSASRHYAGVVNDQVARGISDAQANGTKDFDSGYVYEQSPFPDSKDWRNAVGNHFLRVTGHQNADGTWTVHLSMTSNYQFRAGDDFGPEVVPGVQGTVAVNGAALQDLANRGLAKNYHSIGTTTLTFSADGRLLGP